MEPNRRKKRHPILWTLAVLLALGWLFPRLNALLHPSERALPTAEPTYHAAATPRSTATPHVTVTPRPTVKPTPTAKPTPPPTPVLTPEPGPAHDGVTPEFKATMDSYEAFFDEYVAFMKAVDENPGNLALLLQYAAMLERYTEAMEELDAMGEEELSDADMIYYVQTMARIEVKLLELIQDME